MNQISALPNPLEILFQEYNQGRIESAYTKRQNSDNKRQY